MRRFAYHIGGQTTYGVEFSASQGLYFFEPATDRLYRWSGAGWQSLPISNLGKKRRDALMQVWGTA
jgi:hypothetical protein